MKAAIITCDMSSAKNVYNCEMINELKGKYELCENVICRENMEENADFLRETEYLFSTWGMERFSKEEIKKYFPSLRCLFYAAGSVQCFAREFIECGVRVFSAWKANAVPVAEFTHAQIILALKGFFFAERNCIGNRAAAFENTIACGGAYNRKVGLIGIGCIGSMVAEKLKSNDVKVLCYDKFLSDEKAEILNVKKVSLEELFAECDVISNHLADKSELEGILNASLFERMKPHATFINTGRGRQVNENDLAAAMRAVPTRTALLDVTFPEPISSDSELARLENVIITPHIAGSLGREVERMGRYMLDEAGRIDSDEPALYEVTGEMLNTMA